MMKFDKEFLLGASTAAHQVEGNNIHSDFWAMEQLEHSSFKEPSLDAVDHYNRYKEDMDLMAEAGLNAYRFSIEWARIEPTKGIYDESEVNHYKEMITYCKSKGIEPIITMHHFSSPKWLIENGGWENEATIQEFADYCSYVIKQIGHLVNYVCTINEANMGLQMAAIARDYRKNLKHDIQVGVNMESMIGRQAIREETSKAFGGIDPDKVHHFLSERSKEGDILIMRAHEAARDAMKAICPQLKIGVTLSLHDFQTEVGGETLAAEEWEEEFLHYLPYIEKDDFFGLQNYTRKIVGKDGVKPVPEGMEKTQMNYEYYPKSVSNVIRRISKEISIPILVTENGIATSDDSRRIEFIKQAMDGIKECMEEGITVLGYLHWSLMDNFEWQMGYSRTFGLIAVDRSTQTRHPKESLKFLGNYR